MPSTPSSSRDDSSDTPAPKRTSSGLYGKLFRRHTHAPRPPSLPTPPVNRSAPVAPSSPSLLPSTSAVTAPGSLVQPALHTQSPPLPASQVLSFDYLTTCLTPPVVYTLTQQTVISHTVALESVIRTPSLSRPTFDSIFPSLASLCSAHSAAPVRQAGFDIMTAYLEQDAMTDDVLSEFNSARLWHLLRATPAMERQQSYVLEDDWDSRLRALTSLCREGRNIQGLLDVIPVLITWSHDLALSLHPIHSSVQSIDTASLRFDVDRRLNNILSLLNDIFKHNISTISENDEDALITTFRSIWDASFEYMLSLSNPEILSTGYSEQLARKVTSAPSLSRASSRGASARETGSKTSKHRRHPSSQSSRLLSLRPSQPSASIMDSSSPMPVVSYIPQASAYVTFLSTLLANGPLPSGHVRPTIRSLLLLLAEISSDLPKVTEIRNLRRKSRPSAGSLGDTEDQLSILEDDTWTLFSSVLSGSYAATTAQEIKRILLPHDPTSSSDDVASHLMPRYAHGAARVMRLALRKGAAHRIALYRLETLDEPYSPAGMPAYSQETEEVLQVLYGVGAGEGAFWDVPRVRDVLGLAVRTWLAVERGNSSYATVLECLGIASDMVDEATGTSRSLTQDEAHVVGEVLMEAVQCLSGLPLDAQISSDRRNLMSAVSQFLFSMPLNSPLSPSATDIFLSVADYMPDEKLAEVVEHTFKDTLPFPSTPRWLPIIMDLFAKLNRPDMPLCRRALARCIRKLYDSVRDLSDYRDPLVRIALHAWERSLGTEDDHETVRDVLAVLEDGIVAGAADPPFTQGIYVRPPQAFSATGLDQRIQALIVAVANGCECIDDSPPVAFGSTPDQSRSTPAPPYSVIPMDPDRMRSPTNSSIESPFPSPTIPHHTSDVSTPFRGTVTTGSLSPNNLTGDHGPSIFPHVPPESPDPFLDHETRCKSMNAVITLIRTFSRLAFSPPHSLDSDSPFKTARAPASSKCITVFENLLSLLGPTVATTDLPDGEERPPGHKQARCRRARLAILQWTVRLRADRDHRLYVLDNVDMAVEPFAALVRRGFADSERVDAPVQVLVPEVERESRRQRNGTQRGRAETNPREPSQTPSQSRSKSRLPTSPRESSSPRSPLDPLWGLPDVLPFEVPDDSRPSEGMTTYSADLTEHDGITQSLWLSVSMYVCILTDILHDETDWEILSYTLCHLPLQLSNKHLFCGPRTRQTIGNLVSVLCGAIFNDRLGSKAQIPADLKSTDVHGLAYQTLTILVGYRDSFDSRERVLSESLVQAFCQGLNRYHTVAKPCLQALSICAYELQSPTAKFLPQILDQLVQVISKPAISRQILELLAIIGAIPALYSNLREAQFNLIFTAAGRYIQRHNWPVQVSMSTSGGAQVGGESFALSQHVLVLAYYVIYIWFLGIKRPERPRYIRSIARHLSIANDGNAIMTEMTEVCFDWLARYTYSNGSPRSSSIPQPSAGHLSKTWLMGNSILTVENLPRPGWISITSRRPSGIVHVTSRIDNVTAERLEDIDPQELISTATPDTLIRPTKGFSLPGPEFPNEEVLEGQSKTELSFPHAASSAPSQPENAGLSTAPMLTQDDLEVDPGFLPLQLSQYPTSSASSSSPYLLPNDEDLARTMRVLDLVPVVDLHKVGVMYSAPGQTTEADILGNQHGSPAYTRFLHGLGRLVRLKNQRDVYTAGLDTSEGGLDGEYAYAWWDGIAQVVYHAATMMPNMPHDPERTFKKRHIGNDWVRIVWNDSGIPYRFDTLSTAFQLVNIVIEPHSAGTTAAYSNSSHENEFFKLMLQRAPGMPEFGPVGEFKLLSSRNLAAYVRQVSLLASLFAQVYHWTERDTHREEYVTNWRRRLQMIKKLRPVAKASEERNAGEMDEETSFGDFTPIY